MQLTVQESQAPVAVKAAIALIRQTQAPHIVRLGLLGNGDVELEVQPDALLAVARFLRDTPLLDFQYFNFMMANDKIDYLETIYILNSLVHGIRLQLKVRILPNEPKVDSVTAIWRGANWHEREAYDMFGITFTDHPYPQRMFLDEDFEGYPLRKSFKLAGRAE